jgi:hypothetical protein
MLETTAYFYHLMFRIIHHERHLSGIEAQYHSLFPSNFLSLV